MSRALVLLVLLSACGTPFGARATGERLERMRASPQWKDGAFVNELARETGHLGKMLAKGFESVEGETPAQPPPVVRPRFDDEPAPGLHVTWLGHSTMLLEVDGQRLLIDPVWGERISPFDWAGPTRFHAPPLPLGELPVIDAVLISHDHYDHLDLPTVSALNDRDIAWFVPLGVGAHLELWGVDPARIVELDWWDARKLGVLEVVCTPARHFSGRGLGQLDSTLWSSWTIVGPEHRVFYSGDTALHPEFKTIGERFGPFDLTMMESGAYSPMWRDVHLGPEQAVIAHQLLRGRVMLPVHWGTFDLANHSWVEPIERVVAAAARVGVAVITPRLGERVSVTSSTTTWWDRTVPWIDRRGRPTWSSGVLDLQAASPLYLR